jgi:O-methyltransferase involved in polyketide biosynthesis
MRNKVYWANFYAHTEFSDGSTFFAFVNARPDTPRHVFDVGCGDGRDARAFGAAGRTVLGLDQSPVGIEHASRQTADAGLDDRVTFAVCDVDDQDRFAALVADRLGAVDEPVLFYLRFFLHSIPEDVQDRLLTSIVKHSSPGDMFAAEFRTDKDEESAKVHGKHWRRFQNAAEFSRTLREVHGFTILHEEEATGLSPYGEEDPVLYRVVARR